jgi:hypothetical protein
MAAVGLGWVWARRGYGAGSRWESLTYNPLKKMHWTPRPLKSWTIRLSHRAKIF